MALQKDYETKSGVVGNYHRINTLVITKTNGDFLADIRIKTYLNKTIREDGKDCLELRHYSYEGINPNNPVYEQVYTYLKTLSEFEGAIDV